MKKMLLLASAAIVSGTSAFAADLPARKVTPVAPIAPAFTWTGFYAGLNAGVNWSSRNVETILNGGGVALATYPDMVQALSPQPYGNNRAGFIGGAQIGYNYQINQFVIGAEADFMGMGVSKRSGATSSGASSSDASNFISSLLPGDGTINSEAAGAVSTKITQNWLGTVRARAGFAADRFLVYATGGLAYGNVKSQTNAALTFDQTYTDNTSSPPVVSPYLAGTVPWTGGKTSTQVGYTVGAGVEYAVTNNWIIRGEYLYYNLGSVTNLASVGPAATGTVLETISISSKTKVDGNIVRAAVSYKF
jgi:outer membrane immunogenic protein